LLNGDLNELLDVKFLLGRIVRIWNPHFRRDKHRDVCLFKCDSLQTKGDGKRLDHAQHGSWPSRFATTRTREGTHECLDRR